MDTETQQKTIPDELAGLRLDQALAQMFPEFSRSRLKSWLLKGVVLVDGERRRPKDRIDGGEEIALRAVTEQAVTSKPEPMQLDVIYEDDAMLVINKPAGLVVHPGAGNLTGTLMNGLLHHVSSLEELPRAGIIHRLDKDTTGLMLVGKTLPAHTALTRALSEREVSRHYFAVCQGVLTGGGTINEPIGRHPTDRTRMCARADGRPAVTHFTVRERFRAHSLVAVTLDTGRTHQIRVHLKAIHHPIICDHIYAPKRGCLLGFNRPALHARSISFDLLNGGRRKFEAPLPKDFTNALTKLGVD